MALTLEREFEGIKLKKRTFKRVAKRTLERYHKLYSNDLPEKEKDSDIYNSKELSTIFNETFDTSPNTKEKAMEIFSEELRNTNEYKNMKKGKSKKDNKKNILINFLGGASIFLCLAFGAITISGAIHLRQKEDKYKQAWIECIEKYADFDNDGIITYDEEINLMKKVIQGHGKFQDYFGLKPSRFINGEPIDIDNFTKWIEDYKQEK